MPKGKESVSGKAEEVEGQGGGGKGWNITARWGGGGPKAFGCTDEF